MNGGLAELEQIARGAIEVGLALANETDELDRVTADRFLRALRDDLAAWQGAGLGELEIARITAATVREEDDAALLNLHRHLHGLWAQHFENSDKQTANGLTREDLVNAYIVVAEELERRGMSVDEDKPLARAAAQLGETGVSGRGKGAKLRGDKHATGAWTAKKGEQIRGQLYRGTGGKFASGPSGVMDEETASGLTTDVEDALRKLNVGGTVDQAALALLQKAGLASELGALNQYGKAVLKAAKAEDPEEVKRLMGLAAAKGRGGGGAGRGAGATKAEGGIPGKAKAGRAKAKAERKEAAEKPEAEGPEEPFRGVPPAVRAEVLRGAKGEVVDDVASDVLDLVGGQELDAEAQERLRKWDITTDEGTRLDAGIADALRRVLARPTDEEARAQFYYELRKKKFGLGEAYQLPDGESVDAVVIQNFGALVGSAAQSEEEPGDLDVLIRADRIDGQGGPGFFIRAEDVELPLRHRLDPQKTGRMKVHWSANPQGAHGDYVPLADLVLRFREGPERQVVEIGRRVQSARIEQLKQFVDSLQGQIGGMRTALDALGDELESFEDDFLAWAQYEDGATLEDLLTRRTQRMYGFAQTYEAEPRGALRLAFVGTGAMNTRGRRGAALLVEYAGQRVQIDGEKPEDIADDLDALLVTDLKAWNAKAAVAKGARVGKFEADGLRLTPRKVEHTRHDVYGYLIEAGGKRVGYLPELWEWPSWGKDLDLAVVDGSAWKRDIEFAGGAGGHRALSSLAESARRHGVRRVVATHIGRPTVQALRDGGEIEGVEFAEDGQRIELSEAALAEAVAPGRRYRAMKPSMTGYTEFFETSELWEKWAAGKLGDEHPLLGSPKVDGFRATISWDGSKAAVWFEDAKETKTPPGMPELRGPAFVVEGEFTARRGDKWLARTQLANVAAGKTKAEPHFWLYDLLYHDGEDVSERPFGERLTALKKLNLPEGTFTILDQRSVKDKTSLDKVGRWAAGQPLSEGLFLRQADAPYSFGSTDTAAKMKTVAELKVAVIEALRKTNGVTYHVGLREPGEFTNKVGDLLDLGNTFVGPDQHAGEGDTLNVTCEELVVGDKDGKPILFWGKPTVRGPDKSRPAYTVRQAIDLAQRGHILKEEVEEAELSEAAPEEEETRAETAAEEWAENWDGLVAKGQGRFILHGHFPSLTDEEVEQNLQEVGLSELLKGGHQYHSDLRMEAPKPHGAWGFTVFEGASGKVGPTGTRLTKLAEGDALRGTFKLEQPGQWLAFAKGAPKVMHGVGQTGKEASKFFTLDDGTYKLTYAREHAFEILLDGRKGATKGRYQIAYVPTGKERVWMISRPANQETTFPEEHGLESVLKELKRKGQHWLFWRETPDAPLKKYDVRTGALAEVDMDGETNVTRDGNSIFTAPAKGAEEVKRMIILGTELTEAELRAFGEAVATGAKALAALKKAMSAIGEKDKEGALAALKSALSALESGGYAYGYPEPKEAEEFTVEAEKTDDLAKRVQEAIAALEKDDFDAARAAVLGLMGKLGVKESAELGEAGTGEGDTVEAELAETGGDGAIVGLAEGDAAGAVNADRAPLKLWVEVIRPGWGNKKDNRFYPAEVLRRDASVFEGAKMYATDHRPDEKNVRTEVAVVEKCPAFFSDAGAPVALATIFDPDFAEATRNRARAGQLHTLRCSILAKGVVKPGYEQDGRKGELVEAIRAEPKPDVDWVTRDGAGGGALGLAETEKPPLAKEAVEAALGETNLPQVAREWVAEGVYADEAQLREAIGKAVERVKRLTGSGQVFGQGASTPAGQTAMSGEEYDKRYQAIQERYGLAQ